MVYLKPKQLIIKDCARRFVLKLYRHEASLGLFATAELLVSVAQLGHIQQSSWPISWPDTKLSWLRSLDKYRNAVGMEYADSGRLWGFDIREVEQANEGCRDDSLCKDEPIEDLHRVTDSWLLWTLLTVNAASNYDVYAVVVQCAMCGTQMRKERLIMTVKFTTLLSLLLLLSVNCNN